MRLFFTFVAVVACLVSCGFSILAVDEEPQAQGEDSSAGLPEQYAKDYLIAGNTVSPDKKFAVIYPRLEAEETAENANHPEGVKNYVVALQPFTVLGELQTKYPYFQNESHGGIGADWSDDNSVALITLDGKWGPHDVSPRIPRRQGGSNDEHSRQGARSTVARLPQIKSRIIQRQFRFHL